MQVSINGTPLTLTATTLDAALIEAGFARNSIATAVNGQFVPAAKRGDTPLSDGDRIEVLSPMQGG